MLNMIITVILSIIILNILRKKLKEKKSSYSNNIHIAALYGDIDNIKKMIQNGVNINTKDFSNKTTLMYAAEDGNLETIKFLIENEENKK